LVGLVAAGALPAACGSQHWCFEIDGPCTSGPTTVSFITGFPVDKVDHTTAVAFGFRGVMRVGDAVSLYVVRGDQADITSAADTVRGVQWAIDSQTAAQLTMQLDGGARLVAKSVGQVGMITANGSAVQYACKFRNECSLISQIDVVP
jgi:hypothetical protein